VFDGKADVFYYFLERGLECLRDGGVLGYVVPRYWLGADKAARLRRFLAQHSELIRLLDFDRMPVFARAGVQVCVLVLRKRRPKPSHTLEVLRPLNDSPIDDPSVLFGSGLAPDTSAVTRFSVQQELLGDSWVLVPSEERFLMSAIEAASDSCLGDVASVSPGLITGLDKVRPEGSRRGRRIQEGVFVLSEKEIKALNLLPEERGLVKPWVKNSHVERWTVKDSDLCVLYVTSRPDAASMPNLTRHLERFRPILEARYEIALFHRPWWRLVRPRKPEQFDGPVPKIVAPYKAAQTRFAVDYGRHFCSADVYCINAHDGLLPEYLCCLLNSRLLEFYFRRIAKKMGHTYEYYAHTLVRLPIRVASMAVQQRLKALHDDIVAQILNDRSTGRRREEALRELEQSVNQMVCDVYDIDRGQLLSAKP
jgi:adenine-specific DNA-methyltransferase